MGTKMIGEKETEIFQLDHFSDESSSSVVEGRCHASWQLQSVENVRRQSTQISRQSESMEIISVRKDLMQTMSTRERQIVHVQLKLMASRKLTRKKVMMATRE